MAFELNLVSAGVAVLWHMCVCTCLMGGRGMF